MVLTTAALLRCVQVIKQQICEATDPTVKLDRASLDTFTVAGLREAVAQAVGPGGSSKKWVASGSPAMSCCNVFSLLLWTVGQCVQPCAPVSGARCM